MTRATYSATPLLRLLVRRPQGVIPVNLYCESFIFCEQIRDKIKKHNIFTKPLKMKFSKKFRFDQLAPWVG